MKENHISIGERLRKAKSKEALISTVTDWQQNWYEDQRKTIDELNYCLNHAEYGRAKGLVSQLDAITEKRFNAINRIFLTLLNYEIIKKENIKNENNNL